MTEIIITGPNDVNEILDRLQAMPMTRKYGKGLVARVPVANAEKPAALYIRVSGAKQAVKGKGSLPEQFQASWTEIERRGGQVVAVYADVCTAANRNRWAFNVLLEDLRAGRWVMLGCWHSSRLVRTQLAAGELEDAIEFLGRTIDMFAVTDTLNAEILGVLAWAGRWERKAFRERSLMGRQAAASDNRPPSGAPPFWIEVTRDETNKPAGFALKPVAEWIKWAAETYAAGTGSTEIVARLNLEGVPRAKGRTKYGWTRQYLAQILKYPALKGKWGPFWGQWIDVPALIDEAAWDRVQARLAGNATNSGRPAKHFVALRGLLWCQLCGQKMHAQVRDWDYTYKRLKDGTKARYRVQKKELRIKYVCGGQQHYGFKCRRPEYVRDKVLFPRVWARLHDALCHRELLVAGLESQIRALEVSDEVEELRRLDHRLEQLHQRELSYAEQRADGTITKAVQQELVLRLNDERRELLQARAQLLQKAQLVDEARQRLDTANSLVAALPEVLPELSRDEQERLVMALIARIDVDRENQVTITLRLDPEVLRALPTPLPDSSLRPESELSASSLSEEVGNSRPLALVRHGQQVTVARYTRNKDCTPG